MNTSDPVGGSATSLTMPEPLRPGDRVVVLAPAGPVPRDRLDRGLAWLRASGFDVVEAAALRGRSGHGLPFLAGDDDRRRHDLVTALRDPDVRAVVAARGGDGTPRLLDAMPWDELAAAPPTIVAGLSDLTCLHQALARRLGWATLWSPMPGTAVLGGTAPDEWSRAGLLAALTGRGDPLVLAGQTLVDGPAVTAPLVGGTLALLSAMVGTPGHQRADGAIAVLEDVGERPYRIERFLTHLLRAGFFDGCRGIAVGDLVDCEPADQTMAVVADFARRVALPVVVGLSFGHGPRQASLWLGRPATLDPATATLSQAPRP
ncbi:S66 peptidase family protein [Salsipaludibacter albus]|uniref:S66 peptidase family protein n=1 Tax=Salsipaludibacter albus TaxID=2849650 RepID=UPI001EE3C536